MIEKSERSAIAKALANSIRGYVLPLLSAINGRLDDLDGWRRGLTIPTTEEIQGAVSGGVRQVLAELPPAEKGKDGKDADPEFIKSSVREELAAAIAGLPAAKDGLPGKDGKDAAPVDAGAIAREVLALIPPPNVRDIVAIEVRSAVDAIPPAKDGRDAAPVDVDAVISGVLSRIPTPANGKDADPETVRGIVVSEVQRAVSVLPAPKDGKDAEPIHPDTITLIVRKEIESVMAGLAKPSKGKDGRDALDVVIVPSIDESKSYPRGTFARFQNGLVRAFRNTDPLTAELEKCGWEVIVAGIANIDISQSEDMRSITILSSLTGGGISSKVFTNPALLYREIFKDGEEYQRGDVVTWAGSAWHCANVTKAKPGTSTDWKLMVKRGGDGKDLRPENPLPIGPVRIK